MSSQAVPVDPATNTRVDHVGSAENTESAESARSGARTGSHPGTGSGDAFYFPGLVPVRFETLEPFLRADPHIRDLLPTVDRVLGYPLLERAADAEIYDWEVFEAVHVVVGLALARGLTSRSAVRPELVGGQSFGAVTAAIHAGALDLADGMRLIAASTEVEVDYFAGLDRQVGTLFFYRLATHQVDQLVAAARAAGHQLEISVYLDNLVHAVCGPLDELNIFADQVRHHGGHVFYLMNRAEHCGSLAELRHRLEIEVYQHFRWNDPTVPAISDVDGSTLTTGAQISADLTKGWVTPVRWSLVADSLIASGVQRIFVIGPPSMFTRLVGRSVPTVEVSPRQPGPVPTSGGSR
ncbi:ACP S-malonyltransferase [Nakamurella aerolata]|uniref:[acyl-carrier-protein] S-malonyltransferase n=1 Tax=Nakamurella aerolata TaxID=1656892 RepID=A0A849AC27_9ACTN|nr:ACP S-malonyltransferase [Nakamurella aerolata]NNG36688.1 ACP S-malonyltransferase [Nakamurella aerolata]